MKTYEGMFLLDAGNPDFEATTEPVRAILTRYGTQVLSMKPWDERRLAFEIAGRKRGLYVLTYFKVEAEKMAEIEHDLRLDERVLRSLILRKDKITDEIINAETPATMPRREEEVTAEPTDRRREGGDDFRGGDFRGGDFRDDESR